MDDLNRYIEKRKKQSVEFTETFDTGTPFSRREIKLTRHLKKV